MGLQQFVGVRAHAFSITHASPIKPHGRRSFFPVRNVTGLDGRIFSSYARDPITLAAAETHSYAPVEHMLAVKAAPLSEFVTTHTQPLTTCPCPAATPPHLSSPLKKSFCLRAVREASGVMAKAQEMCN